MNGGSIVKKIKGDEIAGGTSPRKDFSPLFQLARVLMRFDHVAISAKPVEAWGCVATVDSSGRTIFVADAHRDDGKRFVVHADEKLTAFVELESAIRYCGVSVLTNLSDFGKLLRSQDLDPG